MTLQVKNGLLSAARYIESPNQDERPEGVEIDLVVLHNISLPPGEFGGDWIELFFTNCLPTDAHPYFQEIEGMEVSSHLLIRRDGSVTQFVPFDRRAWHAGASCHDGRERCNDFSIGIELEGTDDLPFDERQYQVLDEVLNALINAYPGLGAHTLTGHEHIAPGRKTDPGPEFDWHRVRQSLANRDIIA